MNVWLSEGRAATPTCWRCSSTPTHEMTAWVDELVTTGARARSGDELVAAAAAACRTGGAVRSRRKRRSKRSPE